MATLAGNTIADTYPLLLKIASSGVGSTPLQVEDGDATGSALYLGTATAGIGIVPDSTTFHIHTASAGSVSPNAAADELTLENSGAVGMSMFGGSSSTCTIAMGDSESNYQGVIIYDNNNSNMTFKTANTEALRINDVQNIGIGATPTTFHATLTGVQIGGNGILQHETSAGAGKTFKIAQNVREEITSGDFTYISTDEASLIELSAGGVNIKTAPSGTAGATATMTSRFTVLQGGNVGIGKTPDTPLHIKGAGDTYVTVEAGASDGNVGFLFDDSGSNQHGFVLYDTDDDVMTFGSANTERMRINNTGNIYLGGVTSQVNSSHFQYASTFGDTSYARVGLFNQATGNDSARGMNLQIGQIAGTSHYCADETELAIITFLGQANDAGYVGGSLAVKATTGGNIGRAATGCDMIFSTIDTSGTGASERGRFTSSGTFTVREVTGSASNNAGKMSTSNASYATSLQLYGCARTSSDGWKVMTAYHGDGSNNEFSDVIFEVEGNGDVESDTGSYGTGASDYAEYFESKDGKGIAIGKTVKIENGKVVACEDGDTPMGVVRPKQGACSVIGNKAQHSWHSKWLKNDYDEFIMEDCTVTEWTEKVYNSEEERELGAYTNKFHSYETDKIPSNVTVPSDAKVLTEDSNGNKLQRRKINPDYNSDLKYEPREKRDSWCLIGLLGQIPITKGQPVSSNWIKMKDVSDTVEMYFVK